MLAALIRFALMRRLLILLAVALLLGGGWYALQTTPIDAYPDVSTTQVKIVIKAPGMTPEEVESRITAPVEVEMLGIPRQTMLRSTSKYALADITVDFEEGVDIYWARQQVNERLSGLWNNLPTAISGGVAPMTTPLGEMFMFTIEGGGLSLAERRSLLDWVIRPALRTVPASRMSTRWAAMCAASRWCRTMRACMPMTSPCCSCARRWRRTTATMAPAASTKGGDAAGALRRQHPHAGRRARDRGQADPLEPVRVGDVAMVRLGALTRYGGVTHHGAGETVEGLVLGLRGANANEVVSGVRAKLAALAPTLPAGVKIDVFYDRSELVNRAISTVTHALIEAAVLVIVLLLLFLGNLRAALTVALILPLAAMATFILIRLSGMSANLMSLGGLAIAIGMLVDAAVVVVENIVSQLSHPASARLPRLHLIYRAVREVAVPVTSGIVIIIVVFLPLLTLQGLEGKLFIPVALTIVFALGSSLLLALTVIPALAALLIGRVSHEETALVRLLHRLYSRVLGWSLNHGTQVIAAALILLVGAGCFIPASARPSCPTWTKAR